MNSEALPKPRFRFGFVFLFNLLLFSYPLLSMIWRRSYPIFTLEVGILFLVLMVFSLLLTLVLGNVRQTISNLLSPLLITIILTLQFNFLALGMLTSLIICVLAAWKLRGELQIYALPVLIMLMIGAYADSFDSDGYLQTDTNKKLVNSDLPPVIHILLDGFIGVEGLRTHPGSGGVSDDLYGFFKEMNFRLFPQAYSRFTATGDSVYAAFNYQNLPDGRFTLEVDSGQKHVLESSLHFASMQNLGYRFNVYQTGYLDFCKSLGKDLDRCWEYMQPNTDSIRMVSTVSDRTRMLTKVLMNQSVLLSKVLVSRRWLLDQGITNHEPRVFTELENDIVNQPDGRYFFAHVLLPHGPFAFLTDCSISYETPLWARYEGVGDEPVQSDEVYEIRARNYFNHVSCALKSLEVLFKKMKAAGVYERSTILIHGDHGSRISKHRPEYQVIQFLTNDDYRANYSTLFAVKFAEDTGQVDPRALPLSSLLEGFSGTFHSYLKDPDMTIDKMWTPDSPEKVEPFIYLRGSVPRVRLNGNIFDDQSQ